MNVTHPVEGVSKLPSVIPSGKPFEVIHSQKAAEILKEHGLEIGETYRMERYTVKDNSLKPDPIDITIVWIGSNKKIISASDWQIPIEDATVIGTFSQGTACTIWMLSNYRKSKNSWDTCVDTTPWEHTKILKKLTNGEVLDEENYVSDRVLDLL